MRVGLEFGPGERHSYCCHPCLSGLGSQSLESLVIEPPPGPNSPVDTESKSVQVGRHPGLEEERLGLIGIEDLRSRPLVLRSLVKPPDGLQDLRIADREVAALGALDRPV